MLYICCGASALEFQAGYLEYPIFSSSVRDPEEYFFIELVFARGRYSDTSDCCDEHKHIIFTAHYSNTASAYIQ